MEKMRRFKQELSQEEVNRILTENQYGILSVARGEQPPYSIPLNYVFHNGAVYLHGATAGCKNQLLQNKAAVSFAVVDYHKPDPAKFSASYSSVCLSGHVQTVTEESEMKQVLLEFCKKYFPDRSDDFAIEVEKRLRAVAVWRITPDEMRGKASMELVK